MEPRLKVNPAVETTTASAFNVRIVLLFVQLILFYLSDISSCKSPHNLNSFTVPVPNSSGNFLQIHSYLSNPSSKSTQKKTRGKRMHSTSWRR